MTMLCTLYSYVIPLFVIPGCSRPFVTIRSWHFYVSFKHKLILMESSYTCEGYHLQKWTCYSEIDAQISWIHPRKFRKAYHWYILVTRPFHKSLAYKSKTRKRDTILRHTYIFGEIPYRCLSQDLLSQSNKECLQRQKNRVYTAFFLRF